MKYYGAAPETCMTVARLLNLPMTGPEQDWEFVHANPAIIAPATDLLTNHSLSFDTRAAIACILVESLCDHQATHASYHPGHLAAMRAIQADADVLTAMRFFWLQAPAKPNHSPYLQALLDAPEPTALPPKTQVTLLHLCPDDENDCLLQVAGTQLRCFIAHAPGELTQGHDYLVSFDMLLDDDCPIEASDDPTPCIRHTDAWYGVEIQGYLNGGTLESIINLDDQDIHYEYPHLNEKPVKVRALRLDVDFS
ncbi:hypothetical protein [Pseudomonas xanthosomatis]|uniref:hypothetical protein n=1 Tax=Pseudomonas xanthosomatis TaxID=2842356 RepID=UPI00351995D9